MSGLLMKLIGFVVPTIANSTLSKTVGAASGIGSAAIGAYLLANLDKTITLTYTYGELIPFVAALWWSLEVMRKAKNE